MLQKDKYCSITNSKCPKMNNYIKTFFRQTNNNQQIANLARYLSYFVVTVYTLNRLIVLKY